MTVVLFLPSSGVCPSRKPLPMIQVLPVMLLGLLAYLNLIPVADLVCVSCPAGPLLHSICIVLSQC